MPPLTVISLAVKSATLSDSVKLMVAVLVPFTVVLSLLIAMVGRAVSTAMVALLSRSAPSRLVLPAASLNLLLATLITAEVLLLSAAVKVAV